jgi:hypothetical protein
LGSILGLLLSPRDLETAIPPLPPLSLQIYIPFSLDIFLKRQIEEGVFLSFEIYFRGKRIMSLGTLVVST